MLFTMSDWMDYCLHGQVKETLPIHTLFTQEGGWGWGLIHRSTGSLSGMFYSMK